MPSAPTNITEWLDQLTHQNQTDLQAIASYPLEDDSGPWVDPLFWSLAYYRFESNEWRRHIASCVERSIIGDFAPWRLDATLQRIYDYRSVLATVAPHMSRTPGATESNQQFALDLGLVVSLLQDGQSTDPRSIYFRPLFDGLLNNYDLLADIHQILEEDEWGDLPFPPAVMLPILRAAEADARFKIGSSLELQLTQASFLTSNANHHGSDLASGTYRTAQDARVLCENLADALASSRFGRAYMLGFFATPSSSKLIEQESVQFLRKIASNLTKSLSQHERTSWLRLASSNEAFYKATIACCNAPRPSPKLPKRFNIVALSNYLRPDWAGQSQLWSSLGYTADDWVDAGVAYDNQQAISVLEKGTLPQDLNLNS